MPITGDHTQLQLTPLCSKKVSPFSIPFSLPQNFPNYCTCFEPSQTVSQIYFTITNQSFNTSIMTSSSRVLTCAEYNRRRSRVLPHNDDESTMSTSQPKLSGLKSRMDSQSKLAALSENNNTACPSLKKEVRAPSLESSDSDVSRPVFRRRADLDDDLHDDLDDEEDMFALKRANPVYDSDDDEEEIFSPAKRRRTGEPTVISWCDPVDKDEIYGFAFSSTSLLLVH
jgi:hypothetical protein